MKNAMLNALFIKKWHYLLRKFSVTNNSNNSYDNLDLV